MYPLHTSTYMQILKRASRLLPLIPFYTNHPVQLTLAGWHDKEKSAAQLTLDDWHNTENSSRSIDLLVGLHSSGAVALLQAAHALRLQPLTFPLC